MLRSDWSSDVCSSDLFVLRNIINGDCRIMDWSPSNSDSLKCFNLCRHYTKGARSRRNVAWNITTKPTITFSFKIFAGGNSIIYIPLKALLRSLYFVVRLCKLEKSEALRINKRAKGGRYHISAEPVSQIQLRRPGQRRGPLTLQNTNKPLYEVGSDRREFG